MRASTSLLKDKIGLLSIHLRSVMLELSDTRKLDEKIIKQDHYDAIIIGSGMGALTSASLLAQIWKKRVLIIERHFRLGGFTHTFEREGKYEWDVGLHYVGDMHEGSIPRALFDYITKGEVKWHKMPDAYDRFVYPDMVFDARCPEENLKEDLIREFPAEEEAIEQYFSDIHKVLNWLGRYAVSRVFSPTFRPLTSFLTWMGRKLALTTTGEYLDDNFQDEKLKAILVSQWGDYGLPPARSAFAIHALITSHYFNGGFYPVGGAKTIADSVKTIVEEVGGQLLANNKVDEIIVEKGRAIGVKVSKPRSSNSITEEYYADVILSNAGAYETYTKLLSSNNHVPFLDEIKRFPVGTANVTLYIGLKSDPYTLGFTGENHWLYSSYDHDDTFAERNNLLNGAVANAYLSFPSMKNKEAQQHTMEIISFLDYEPFREWAEQPWKNRGIKYEALKEQMSDALIDFVENRYPGFKDLIAYQELSTPLSTEYFTGHREGSIYGIPAVPERFHARWMGVHTPIKGLYLTGSDAFTHGIVGTMLGGVLATSAVTGTILSLLRIFREARRYRNSRAPSEEKSMGRRGMITCCTSPSTLG
ncbi:MAG: phytoene desaturase family protein [Candidatus Thorarchaeota archaeon]|jgi:phytoene dehydrogenase-like protein